MRPLRPGLLLDLFLLCIFAQIFGCGSGGTLPGFAPDFTVTITPSSATLLTSDPAAAFTAQIHPINGFSAPVTLSVAAPTGMSCMEPACATTMAAGTTSSALHLTPGTALGTYTLTFTAVSGTLTRTGTAVITINPPPVSPTPDFTFAVSPTSSSLVAGSSTPAYSIILTPLNGFAGQVTVTASAPSGFTCLQTPCSVTTSASISNALQFSTDAALSAGTYTLTFTATSGTVTHTAAATLTITSPPLPTLLACGGTALTPTTPVQGPSAFVYTGGVLVASLYDSRHNVIFATNHQLGEVEVISPNTLSVLARIPVTQPEGLDITPDLSTLIVGTDAHFFYRIDTSSLCVIDRPYLTGISNDLSLEFPVTLSDGSILFLLRDGNSTAEDVFRWTSSGGFTEQSNAPLAGEIIRSGDHRHAFLSEFSISSYDVSTGTFTSRAAGSGYPVVLIAANFDGSRLYYSDFQSTFVLDANLNTVNTLVSSNGNPYDLLSADGSRLYAPTGGSSIAVFDANSLTTLGYLPGQFLNTQLATYDHIDGAGRFLVSDENGLRLIAFDSTLQATSDAVTMNSGSLSVDSTEFGTSTLLDYTQIGNPTPVSVTLSEGPVVMPATVSSATASPPYKALQIGVPSFTSGCADISARFNVGLAFYLPGAFCYGPTVYDIDGDSGPTSGGGVFTVFGKGFGSNPTVRVGGTSAVVEAGPANSTTAFEPEQLSVTVPPGIPGSADIVITNGGGASLTLANAYTYFTRQDTALPTGSAPSNLIYDAVHAHLLWTDSARNLLVVSSPQTGETIQEVPIGDSPLGLSLSPDGTKVAIATTGDRTVTLYDAISFAKLQSAVIPIPPSSEIYVPQEVAIMSNGTVLIFAPDTKAFSASSYLPGYYSYDLASNVIAPLAGISFPSNSCESFADIIASVDGTLARLGDQLYAANTGTFTPIDYDEYFQCTQIGLSADGAVTADVSLIADSSGRQRGLYNVPWEVGPKIGGSIQFNDNSVVNTLTINASGSLIFKQYAAGPLGIPFTPFLRIFDAQHGSLVRTVSVPGGFTFPSFGKPIALDPSGQNIWMFTPAGLTLLQFVSDPLAIGEVQTTNGTLIVLGSGFTSSLTVSLDGQQLSSIAVTGTTKATAPLPALASGTHSVIVSNPGQPAYVLPDAFTTP